MASKPKRSSGGYGLRRTVAKKHLDEDFEYYFSRIGTQLDSQPSKRESEVHRRMVVVDFVKPEEKPDIKVEDIPGKRPRGRPRKIPVASVPFEDYDLTESEINFTTLKEKRVKKPKILYVQESETCKAVGEICKREDDIGASQDEEIDKRNCLSADVTLLHEELTSVAEEVKQDTTEHENGMEPHLDGEEVVVEMTLIPPDGEEEEEEDDDDEEAEGQLAPEFQHFRSSRVGGDSLHDKVECTECHKMLKPSSYRQHLRTHSGEKPFHCQVCGARFTRKGDVERHVRIVHNKQKPFKCCRCQRAFGDKKNLRWHLMNHDKKLFYVCETCGFKFGKREYWENHVRFIHPMAGGTEPEEEEAEDNEYGEFDEAMLEEAAVDDPPGVLMETLPVITQIGEGNSLKLISLKGLNLSNLVRIAGPSEASEGDVETMEAVVIQLDEDEADEATSLIRVVTGPDERKPLVIEAEEVGASGVEPSNVISIVLNEQHSEEPSQSLIDALLVAAKESSEEQSSVAT